ncbi:hypothetical protein Tco_0992902 [Tanacetum coccineum]|uniref:Uncharacterized protein n=1 Tax=Tanacetum coccineum TaxID=301880 RepID=A0ABQ5F456_9ASTR
MVGSEGWALCLGNGCMQLGRVLFVRSGVMSFSTVRVPLEFVREINMLGFLEVPLSLYIQAFHCDAIMGQMYINSSSLIKSTDDVLPRRHLEVVLLRSAKDKGKAIMEETATPKKVKKRTQMQLSMDEELARKIEEEERIRFNTEQEARALQEEEE